LGHRYWTEIGPQILVM